MSMDDAPALGGQSDDNAPMISSVQTRVIADVRGAYLAGNLDALIERMSDQQRNTFKHAVLQWAWEISVQAEADELRLRSPEMHEAARCVERWLTQPIPGYLQDVQEALDRLDWWDEPDQMMFDFVEAVVTKPLFATAFAIDRVAYMHNLDSLAHELQIQKIVRQWPLDVAWGLLQGKNLPQYPAIDAQTIDAAISNLPRMFKDQNLNALIFAFNEDQAYQFWHQILGQALTALEKVLPRSFFDRTARNAFTVLSKCHTDATEPNWEAYSHLMGDLLQRTHRNMIYLWLHTLFAHFYAPDQRFDDAPGQLCRSAEEVQHVICAAESGGQSRTHSTYKRIQDQVYAWQLEAAWAILHDDPIPPLELTP
jgi:hypothetical protein